MKEISWWKINLGEEEVSKKINTCIQNKSYSMGFFSQELENKIADITGFKHIILTTSGSCALLMASIAAEVSKNDLVCIPNRTWIATAHAPHLLGSQIMLIDTEKNRPIINNSLLDTLPDKPKVIYPVSLNGNYANVDSIKKQLPGVTIIEDCAQALLSYNKSKHIGLEADMACFSLGMAKFLPVGQGGFIATNSNYYAEKLKLVRTHGVDSVNERTPFLTSGFNFRPSDISACVALAQINKLEKRRNALLSLWRQYRDFLNVYQNIKITPVNINEGELPIYIEVISPYRDLIVEKLNSYGIKTRKVYPDLDTANYINFKKPIFLDNSRIFGEQSFVLPSGPDRSKEEINYVFSKLKIILDSIN